MDPIQLNAPSGVSSVSYSGQEYQAVKGVVSVPSDAVPDLLQQGFSLAG